MSKELIDGEQQINVEISEEMAEGVYSNLALIAHSPSEFVLDFIRLLPGVPKARVKARVILTPEHAKRLLMALHDNVQKYEQVHGPIQEKSADGSIINFPGFAGPGGEA